MGVVLSNVTLCGWKSIGEGTRDLPLRNLNVLIGPNGAGKSNFISFFQFLQHLTDVPYTPLPIYSQALGGASALLHDGPEVTSQIKASLTFNLDEAVMGYSMQLDYAAGDSLYWTYEHLAPDSALQLERPIPTGYRDWALMNVARAGDPRARALLRLITGIVVYQFHNTSMRAGIRQYWDADDNLHLREDAANLAPFLLRLRENHPRHYSRILDTIRLVAPFVSDFVLEPQNNRLMLRWREQGTDLVFGAHQMSDGTLRAIALIALLFQPEKDLPPIFFLDEPELGLHPFAIQTITGLLKSASLHHQIVVATQSPALLDALDPADVIVVDRVGRESRLRRLDAVELTEWLEEYSLGELWEKNVLGGRPHP